MSFRLLSRIVVALAVLTLIKAGCPCSWAVGYFNQVTALRGTVVGVNNGDWRHPFRWIRHRVSRGDAKLTLFTYQWPVKNWSALPIVKVVWTDKRGRFDFGVLPKGHYTLRIDDPWGGASWFDVEIASLHKRIDLVLIDISPNYPDCTGGHEFLPISG